jgi:hypothetical protein
LLFFNDTDSLSIAAGTYGRLPVPHIEVALPSHLGVIMVMDGNGNDIQWQNTQVLDYHSHSDMASHPAAGK